MRLWDQHYERRTTADLWEELSLDNAERVLEPIEASSDEEDTPLTLHVAWMPGQDRSIW